MIYWNVIVLMTNFLDKSLFISIQRFMIMSISPLQCNITNYRNNVCCNVHCKNVPYVEDNHNLCTYSLHMHFAVPAI